MPKIHGTKLSQSKFSRMSWLGLAGTVSCCALVLVFGLMLFPSLPQSTYAAPEITPSTGTSVGINLPASIDFNSVTPTPDGVTTTATADLTITTTNSASYSLYLYSSDGDNSLRPKISANTSSIIATAGGVGLTLSSLEPNTWGYSLGTTEPTDTTTYSAVPTSNDTPIQTKDTSATASANDTYTLSFGAKVDTSIPSGTYTGTLTVAVVAEPALVTIAFDGNGATGGSMSNQQIVAGQTANLNTNQYTRNGYDFTGWNTNAGGTGTSYTDGASYTAPSSSAGQTVTLYAQWEAIIYMQDLTLSECQAKATDMPIKVIDVRDGNIYNVRYFSGNCWMAQNLRIGSGVILTPSDSNVNTNYTIPYTTLEGNNSSVTEGQVQDSGDQEVGYWYNYCAATAGTICSTPNSQDARYDICPTGWSMPSYNDTYFGALGSQESTIAFSPVFGGSYENNIYHPDWAVWWTSSYRHDTARIPIQGYKDSTSGIPTNVYSAMSMMVPLSSGLNIRCILKQ